MVRYVCTFQKIFTFIKAVIKNLSEFLFFSLINLFIKIRFVQSFLWKKGNQNYPIFQFCLSQFEFWKAYVCNQCCNTRWKISLSCYRNAYTCKKIFLKNCFFEHFQYRFDILIEYQGLFYPLSKNQIKRKNYFE